MAQLNPHALDALGVQPLVGRLFRAEEDVPGGDVHKAIISYGLWHRRFGGARDIVGRPIRTPQTTLTIVGVMPEGFGFPDHVELWTPMESYYAVLSGGPSGNASGNAAANPQNAKPRTQRNYGVVARLADGATFEQAQAELGRISVDLEREFPKENAGVRARLVTLREAESGDVRPYLWLLGGAVGFVLLICCANVANMLIARGSSIHRDLSIRLALGASRPAIVRGIIVESLVLSVTGAAFGVALASVALRVLMALIPGPLPSWVSVEIDSPVLVFSIALALVTAIVFSLAPAAQALRLDLTSALKEGTRGATGREPPARHVGGGGSGRVDSPADRRGSDDAKLSAVEPYGHRLRAGWIARGARQQLPAGHACAASRGAYRLSRSRARGAPRDSGRAVGGGEQRTAVHQPVSEQHEHPRQLRFVAARPIGSGVETGAGHRGGRCDAGLHGGAADSAGERATLRSTRYFRFADGGGDQ